MGIATTQLPRSWPELGHFMRKSGLRWLYVSYVVLFSIVYVQMVTVDSEAFPDKEYPPLGDLKITIYRLWGSVLFLPSLLLAAWYLCVPLPMGELNPDADFKVFPVESLSVKSPLKHRPHAHCVIVFVVTRGEYPKMIRRNVTYHLTLLERYLRCDRLEAHVVTERPLEGDYQVGSGWVREIVVPTNYKTPNGSLFRARNIVYWLKNGPAGGDYPPEDKTWLLCVDEDVFVTEGFVREFAGDFLSSDAVASRSMSLAYFDEGAKSLANNMIEGLTSILCMAFAWLEVDLLKIQPVWFRGCAYVIRRDVDRDIGRDFGPELSVADDHVFGNYAAIKNIKFRTINAWTYEGAACGWWGMICQRARWTRGYLLASVYQKLPLSRKFSIIARNFLCHFFLPLGTIPILAGTVHLWFGLMLGRPLDVLHIAPRVWYLDYMCSFSVATWNYVLVYGFWLLLPSKRAFFCTLAVLCWVLSLWNYVVQLFILGYLIIIYTSDYIRGTISFEFTKKKDD